MSFIHQLQENQRLLIREEGKIKSYESSVDLRSWSHDTERRSRYLQDWMKSEMPIRVVPGHKLAIFLNTMTCKSRRKVTPKCHPDCKSKLVLETLCNSCSAMEECLKNDNNFSAFFQEEEFETCYWPCDRCLEVLKNIKMFWKIILEKVFNIKIPKGEDFGDNSHKVHRVNTVHSVAKMWEKEIIEQAMFVNKIMPILSKNSRLTTKKLEPMALSPSKEIQTVVGDIVTLKSAPKSSLPKKINPRRKSRSTSVKIKMVDNETNTSEKDNEDVEIYKHNIEYLQRKFNRQENEMADLKRENNSLKLELENFYENCSWKLPISRSIKCKADYIGTIDSNTALPKPFECCTEEINQNSDTRGIDSEMIITMRNCKNQNFKHISLLQVLHKTNESVGLLDDIAEPCHTKQNPVELLTKVRNAFGELVQRELNVALKVKTTPKKSEITASFCRVNISKSEPSCSTLDFTRVTASSSESQFVSL
ncbi:uncharacterized protein LOC128670520 [Plodia interpunctella]|uniref:uncharacterized protein LOC128670520 n=1 Tax=Plodia interpunctella TaxID=58824 RepID=UPI002367BFF9|nr:uncharacterized protein LOC128670520 [Plodia interpunctella]